MNVPLLNGFENGVNSGPESDKDMKYNSKNQKDATSGRLICTRNMVIHKSELMSS